MFDYAIKNGLIVDGTRREAYNATVYIKDGLIAEISADSSLPSAKVIDAVGKIVAPGFIDLHTHSDLAPLCAPNFESAVHQGVTFNMMGNCGSSIVPNSPATHNRKFETSSSSRYSLRLTGEETNAGDVATYLATVDEQSVAIHVGTLVGHGTIRNEIMGEEDRAPTLHELEQMKRLLDVNLAQGAFGLSLGLTYVPGTFSNTAELIELARVVQEYDAVLAVHMRSEGAGIFTAVEEMLTVARETGVKLHISHLKLMWEVQWGKTEALLKMLDDGRAEGLCITADQYPYCASSTGLKSLLPSFAKRGSRQEFEARFADPEIYRLIKQGVEQSIVMRGGPQNVTVANTRGRIPVADGKHLGELADMWNISPADAYCRVIRTCEGNVSAIYHAMNPADMLEIMKRIDVCVGSDGFAHDFLTKPILGKPHPRSVGTFPRFIQTVRENNLMSIENAVYKMTGLPAEIMGLPNRGVLKPGAAGDITVFDYTAVEDCASFESPSMKPKGIEHVFVAGKPVLLDGVQTSERNGRFITR